MLMHTVINTDMPVSSSNGTLLHTDLVQGRPFVLLLVYFLLQNLKLISLHCKTH